MEDIRNALLAELVDKMHSRLAEKMYPTEKPKEELVEEKPEEPKAEAVTPETDADEAISDAEIDEMMKSAE